MDRNLQAFRSKHKSLYTIIHSGPYLRNTIDIHPTKQEDKRDCQGRSYDIEHVSQRKERYIRLWKARNQRWRGRGERRSINHRIQESNSFPHQRCDFHSQIFVTDVKFFSIKVYIHIYTILWLIFMNLYLNVK